MIRNFRLSLMAATLGAAFTSPATAQTLLTGDHSISGNLCAGPACTGTESFGNADLKLKSNFTELLFEDTSSSPLLTRDWSIVTNDFAGGDFNIIDQETGNRVLAVVGAAPAASIFVANTGHVGLGTTLPLRALHIIEPSSPAIRLEDNGAGSHGPQKWDITADIKSMRFTDITNGRTPFAVASNAPSDAFAMNAAGFVGLGTDNPDAQLELSSDATFNFFRITATGAAVNDSVDITFTGGPLGTGQLRYNIVDGDNQEMSLDADGNLVIDGTLTTSGPTCAAGCDRVFDADYDLMSIQEYGKKMFTDQYLPYVGATTNDQPVNVTEKMSNMLNALEHAHIYIQQQQEQLEAQAGQMAKMKMVHDTAIAEMQQAIAALQSR